MSERERKMNQQKKEVLTVCKILDKLVCVRVSKGVGPVTAKDRAKTEELRVSTGDQSYKATALVFPTDPFASITAVQKEFMSYYESRRVATGFKGEGLVSVTAVSDLRQKYAEARVKIAQLCAELAPKRDQIVADQVRVKNGTLKDEDYPAVLPLDKWFYIEMQWMPHCKESPLSAVAQAAETELVKELRADMQADLTRQIESARDDLMDRVKTVLGGFVRKMQRLRTEVRVCPNCDRQWEAASGDTCPKCGALQTEILPKSERMVGTTITKVSDLADELKAIIPADIVPHEAIDGALKGVTCLTPIDVKFATPNILQEYEREGRESAQNVADLIMATFKI